MVYQNSHFVPDIQGIYSSQYCILCGDTARIGQVQKKKHKKKITASSFFIVNRNRKTSYCDFSHVL